MLRVNHWTSIPLHNKIQTQSTKFQAELMDFLDVWWISFIFFFLFCTSLSNIFERNLICLLLHLFMFWLNKSSKNAHIFEPWFNSKQNCPKYSSYVSSKTKMFSNESQFTMFVIIISNLKLTIHHIGCQPRPKISWYSYPLLFFLSFHNKYLSFACDLVLQKSAV